MQGPRINCLGTAAQQDDPSRYESPAPPPCSWFLLALYKSSSGHERRTSNDAVAISVSVLCS